jgi:hypothetical protein
MNIELLHNNQNMGHYIFIHIVLNYKGKCSLEHMAHCQLTFLITLNQLWIIIDENHLLWMKIRWIDPLSIKCEWIGNETFVYLPHYPRNLFWALICNYLVQMKNHNIKMCFWRLHLYSYMFNWDKFWCYEWMTLVDEFHLSSAI